MKHFIFTILMSAIVAVRLSADNSHEIQGNPDGRNIEQLRSKGSKTKALPIWGSRTVWLF